MRMRMKEEKRVPESLRGRSEKGLPGSEVPGASPHGVSGLMELGR